MGISISALDCSRATVLVYVAVYMHIDLPRCLCKVALLCVCLHSHLVIFYAWIVFPLSLRFLSGTVMSGLLSWVHPACVLLPLMVKIWRVSHSVTSAFSPAGPNLLRHSFPLGFGLVPDLVFVLLSFPSLSGGSFLSGVHLAASFATWRVLGCGSFPLFTVIGCDSSC